VSAFEEEPFDRVEVRQRATATARYHAGSTGVAALQVLATLELADAVDRQTVAGADLSGGPVSVEDADAAIAAALKATGGLA
jgi:hypothetical protein